MTGIPCISLDPFDEAFLADPYPGHEQMRELGPVVHLDSHGIWAMARHEQVYAALHDEKTYSSAAGVGLSDFRKETPWRPPSLLLEADPPEHTAARETVSRVLTPKAIRTLREDFTAAARSLFDALAGRDRLDGVRDIAESFPLTVFPAAIGLPPQARDYLLPYGSMVFNGFGPRNRLFTEAMADSGPVREWITAQCARENLVPGRLGTAIHDAAASNGYDAAAAGMLVRSFLSAGVDTTVHAIGNTLLCLAQNPDAFAALRADPSLARQAFEEVIRLEAPVQTFFRTTTRDVEVAPGARIPAGEKVLLFLGAANRDPRRWPDPERFDIHRKPVGHTGFGRGVHACVGQQFARLEAEILLAEVASRYATLAVDGPVERRLNNTLRGLRSLPLAVTPA